MDLVKIRRQNFFVITVTDKTKPFQTTPDDEDRKLECFSGRSMKQGTKEGKNGAIANKQSSVLQTLLHGTVRFSSEPSYNTMLLLKAEMDPAARLALHWLGPRRATARLTVDGKSGEVGFGGRRSGKCPFRHSGRSTLPSC
jgi:hypothetical protein